MTPTKPALPAGTQVGFAYEYGVDIDLAYPGTPSWQTIRRITAVAPTSPPITEDASTYDDFGAPNADKLSESWTLGFGVQVNRLTSGLYAPEVEALKAYTEPDALGELAVAHVRWYDKPYSGTPNPGDAYEGLCTVGIERGNTGNTGVGTWNITLTGKGKRTKITNPFAGWTPATPVVSAATPSGAAAGSLVRIDGANLLGATSVKFGAVSATVFNVVSASTVMAVVPAGSAGSAPVTVITPVGTSNALAYTRGA